MNTKMLTGFSVGSQFLPKVTNWHTSRIDGLRETRTHSLRIRVSSKNTRLCSLNQSKEISPIHLEQNEDGPLVKMCGITSARDAALAAEAGANFIGMILCPNKKRSISLDIAKEISRVAREYGAEPVGVFVDDDANEILRVSEQADLEYVQLHGAGSRAAFSELVKQNRVMYVLHANSNGELLNHISDDDCSQVDWVLVDSAAGGSGKGFNWSQFRLPEIKSKHGWLLAGGINPENVCKALLTLRPHGVDVSSGICAPDGIQKDGLRISSFMTAVNSVRY